MFDLLLMYMLLINIVIRVFLSDLRYHSRHQGANRVLALIMRQETVRILCEVIFLKVILIIHALLKFVTALMNNLLSVLLISSL
jgi:hypothetical protein